MLQGAGAEPPHLVAAGARAWHLESAVGIRTGCGNARAPLTREQLPWLQGGLCSDQGVCSGDSDGEP